MSSAPLPHVAGVILAGGRSSRFGSNKALADLNGAPLISRVAHVLEGLFTERLLVTNSPGLYSFLGWASTADRFADAGPLAGIHAALSTIKAPWAFVVGCDMPNLDHRLIRHLCSLADRHQAVIPRHHQGQEPLHALYHRSALPQLEAALQRKHRRIGQLLQQLAVRWVEEPEILAICPDLSVFKNVNHTTDLATCHDGITGATGACHG